MARQTKTSDEPVEVVAARERNQRKLAAFGKICEAAAELEFTDRRLVLRACWAFMIDGAPENLGQ